MTKKIFVILISTFVLLGLLTCCATQPDNHKFTFDEDYIFTVQMEKDSDFKILQLTDVQVTNRGGFMLQSKLIDRLIDSTEPDLIVLTGDNSDGNFNLEVEKAMIEYFDGKQIPWAPVFGNHDFEGIAESERSTKDRRKLGELFTTSEYGLFAIGEESLTNDDQYIGNYIINIQQGDDLMWSVFMLDSGSYEPNGYDTFESDQLVPNTGGSYAYVSTEQIEWYAEYVKKLSDYQYGTYDLQKNYVVPSLAFFHIPLCEMLDVYMESRQGIMDNVIDGVFLERPACGRYNSGLFDKAKELGSTKCFSFGHDHINSAIVNYEDITMCYGLKTGSASYHKGSLQGGTLFTLNSSGTDFTVMHIYE